MARGKRGSGASSAAKASNDSAQRFDLGPFWLWYRRDRDDWNICWLDGRVTRRASTGIGGDTGNPPEDAKLALIDHWTGWKAKAEAIEPSGPLPPGEVLVADLTAAWLEEHVAHLDAPERYLDSVDMLERFWAELRGQRLLPEPFTVSKVSNALVDQFIAWRGAQGVSAPTISRDLAALRGPINWGLKADIGRLTSAPRVKDVKGRTKPKDLEWSPEQVAALLEAARASVEREHVHLFTMIMLSTHARSEATLELDADTQIKRGMIHFLRPGEDQTRKRRTIVLICPTLAPWLEGVAGKVIRYRVPTSDKKRAAGAGRSAAGRARAGGAEGNRTPDLCSAIAALSHLSYSPGEHTDAHLRYQRDTKLVELAAARVRR
jgi:hypothetical protein